MVRFPCLHPSYERGAACVVGVGTVDCFRQVISEAQGLFLAVHCLSDVLNPFVKRVIQRGSSVNN